MNNIGIDSLTGDKLARNQPPADEAPSVFRRRTLIGTGRWSCPRRYVMAILLCIMFLIQVSRHTNVAFTLANIIMDEERSEIKYASVGNWTVVELETLSTYLQIGEIFSALLGALIIYQVSSHKFILVSVTISSILHMLIPEALAHHSVSFLLIVMIGHDVLSIPMFIAALSLWKDWAPPEERMRLVTISLCALILTGTAILFYLLLFPYVGEILNYYIGAAGLVWALFWYNITADTPQNDPLISEKEYLYLESKIPTNMQEKIKLKDVPWMSILKCKQIYILCAIFFKMSCSVNTIQIVGVFFLFQLKRYEAIYHMGLLLTFICTLSFLLIGVSVVMDFLTSRYKIYGLTIRKLSVCGSYILQCILMIGAVIAPLDYVKGIFFCLSFLAFALSVPGCLTYPLDISPRYVPLIAGIAFAFYCLGMVIFYLIVDAAFETIELSTISWLYLIDGTVSLTTAIAFGIWADFEEQQWSLVSSSRHRSHDYTSYPKPDDDEDLNLVEVTA